MIVIASSYKVFHKLLSIGLFKFSVIEIIALIDSIAKLCH